MKGIVVYATEQARKKHEGREGELERKAKKQYCPSCEIKFQRKTNFISEAISDEMLESN